MNDDKDMTPAEAAKILRCTARMVQKLAATGKIGHYKVGRLIRITAEHINAYRQGNTRGASVVAIGGGK